jgi:hypothetical protein
MSWIDARPSNKICRTTTDPDLPFSHSPLPSGGGLMSCVNRSGPTRASSRTCGNNVLCVWRSSVSVARRFAEASPTLGFVRTACEIALLIENRSARASVQMPQEHSKTAAIRTENFKPESMPIPGDAGLNGGRVRSDLVLRSTASVWSAALSNSFFHSSLFASWISIGTAPPIC